MTRLGDCRRTAVAAVSSVAVVALMGCGQILGADEYGMADAPPVSACASPDAPVGPGGTCTAVGVIDCAKGFVPDGQGGCDPILPPEAPCRPGTKGFPGTNACSALQICFPRYNGGGQTATGAARWYVDQAAPAGGDGTTPDTPFTTIMAAVRAAGLKPATILIAPGEYRETIEVAAPLLLWGACQGGTGDPATTLRAPDDTSGPVVQFSPTVAWTASRALPKGLLASAMAFASVRMVPRAIRRRSC